MSYNEIVVSNIRRIADEKGIKHLKIAEACGMTPAEFSRMLSGKRPLRADNFPPIVSVIGCDYNALFAADNPA